MRWLALIVPEYFERYKFYKGRLWCHAFALLRSIAHIVVSNKTHYTPILACENATNLDIDNS